MRFLTAGESHGPALVGILEGVPAGLKISEERIRLELVRRKGGIGRGSRQSIENEDFEVLSGVRFGETIGSPVSIVIKNQDWPNWKEVMSVFGPETEDRKFTVPRPGHADLAGSIKYNHKDLRNVLERASARETAIRVALAVIAKIFLEELGIQIYSRVINIGGQDLSANSSQWWKHYSVIEQSKLRSLGDETPAIQLIEQSSQAGTTLGGVFELAVIGLPIGLGDYDQWDQKLDGDLAKSLMSLNAIKGVEIGDGFKSSSTFGHQAHDEFFFSDGELQFKTNRSGGLTAGITTGAPLIVRAAMKPLSTLKKPLKSVDIATGSAADSHYERSDVCAVPSAAVIAESLIAMTLMNSVLIKFGGDSMSEIVQRVKDWRKKEGQLF